MKHPYAEILIAIADGEQIQWQDDTGDWVDQSVASTLEEIVDAEWPPENYRIKPKTIMVNWIECPQGETEPKKKNYRVVISTGVCLEPLELWYATSEDAATVFNALVKPFKEQS